MLPLVFLGLLFGMFLSMVLLSFSITLFNISIGFESPNSTYLLDFSILFPSLYLVPSSFHHNLLCNSSVSHLLSDRMRNSTYS